MDFIIIFIPDSLKYKNAGFLVGIHQEKSINNSETFFICDLCKEIGVGSPKGFSILGSYSTNEKFYFPRRKKNWVSITNLDGDVVVSSVIVKGFLQNEHKYRVVNYFKGPFLKSELIILNECENFNSENDYFKQLTLCLKRFNPEKDVNFPFSLLFHIINFWLWLLSWIYDFIMLFMPILKYSTSGNYIRLYILNLMWFLKTFKKDKALSIKTGNYLASFVIDIIFGYILLYQLTHWTSPKEIFNFASTSSEKLVTSLFLLVEWLMGSPAGLKLNKPLNEILGGFFLYNINLWWAFLKIISPLLQQCFFIFLKIGLLGFTFQLAIVQDVITLITFHTYCIYIYAARLFGLQLSGLYSLSRVFLGRNRNPEPGRVDSCPYTIEQLFVGTISFTVLFFLLPTTMVYYIVFMLIRLNLNLISAIMSWTVYFIQALPIYSTFLWFFFPNYITMTVKMTPKEYCMKGEKRIILEAMPVNGPWLTTMSLCKPDSARPPPPFDWKGVSKKMISGKLISPW